MKAAGSVHIQLAIVCGACIIVLALVFKKLLHIPVPHLEAGLLAIVFTLSGGVVGKAKFAGRTWSKAWFWALMMLLITAIIILRRLV